MTGWVLTGGRAMGAATGAGPRHRRARSWFPRGRHRAPSDVVGIWVVPLFVAVVIVAVLTALLLVTDALTL